MLILLQDPPEIPPWPPAVQVGVLALLVVAIATIVFQLIRIGVGKRTLAQGERSWLDYGNFYVVVLGIAAALFGFLVILLVPNRFTDGTQALGFLTALFGAIVGLVGTYFGVKSSADAREGTERALAAGGTTTPTITIAPQTASLGVGDIHKVIATVTSIDGSPAGGVPVIFTVTAGPDTPPPQTVATDSSGKAPFEFTNNNTVGVDTIEAVALEGKGTATVTFVAS